MEIHAMQVRALEVRERFAEFEKRSYGKEWSTEDLVMGLMTDLGDLAAVIQRVEGRRPVRDRDPLEELRHELSDCLWVLLVLADRYDVDMAAAFTDTMSSIDAWLEDQT